jgi:hypothetical protein
LVFLLLPSTFDPSLQSQNALDIVGLLEIVLEGLVDFFQSAVFVGKS